MAPPGQFGEHSRVPTLLHQHQAACFLRPKPGIRAGLENLKLGEVSEVLPNAQGFNIFNVNDRKPERQYEVSEIKEELPDAVAQAQFREKYDVWLRGLRTKAQIEYRDLTVETQRRSGYQRLAMLDARSIDGMAGREVVAGIEHHVGARDQRLQAGFVDALL